ncbi:MAG TPA: hypothetical protein DIU15_16875 [Deltaproteobacteria bacterium]|nr:hypothetical protein [Deltaproteobacteria bacterium]HCP47718.1 hypothetical protein [Deltaproteobacteria bacterium]
MTLRRSLTPWLAGFAVTFCVSCIDTLDSAWFTNEAVDAYHWPHNEVPKDHIEEVQLLGDTLEDDQGAPTLHGVWLHPCADDRPQDCPASSEFEPANRNKTLLYFHGQDKHLGAHWDRLQILWRMGYRVFAIDYRGYGRSTGQPSEAGLYADGRTALRHVLSRIAEERGIDLEEGELPRADILGVAYYGRSLGTTVAVDVATEFNPAALVLESPLASAQGFVDSAAGIGVSASVLMTSRFDNVSKLPFVIAPKLIMHGQEDDYVRFDFAELLFELATEPKEFFAVAGAGHGGVPCPDRDESVDAEEVPCVANSAYLEQVHSFFDQYLP